MSDMESELVPLQRQAKDFGQSVDGRAPARGVQARQKTIAPQVEGRNRAWLVLEILFVTVLVFFWL